MAFEYYETLGISRDASPEEVKRAYRKRAMESHPDRHGGDRDKEALFKQVNEAYATLSDPEKRARYDRFGTAGDDMSSGFSGFENVDISDIFQSFFGGGQARGGRRRREDGEDIERTIRMSFAEAITGVHRVVSYERRVVCTECLGSGSEHGAKPRTCPGCHGSGHIRRRMQTLFGLVEQTVACDTCAGEGTIIDAKCHLCKGKKYVSTKVERPIDVPVGVDNGMSMKIPAEGHEGLSGKHGDLYIAFEVPESHEGLERRDLDLVYTLALDPVEFVLGTRRTIEIPVLGEHPIEVAAGTQVGEVLRYRGEGVKHVSREVRGDLHIVLTIRIPTRLSKHERELYESIAEERGLKGKEDKGIFGKIFGE